MLEKKRDKYTPVIREKVAQAKERQSDGARE